MFYAEAISKEVGDMDAAAFAASTTTFAEVLAAQVGFARVALNSATRN